MDKRIGRITHYFGRIGVAVLELEEGLQLGDAIRIVGHTTELEQQVRSLEIDHRPLQAVSAGAEVALKVDQRVRVGDLVFREVERHVHFRDS